MKKQKLIERFTAVHGNRYDYCLVPEQAKTTEKVLILCKEHGVFSQSSCSHFNKSGCPECGKQGNRKSFEDFVSESHAVHGEKYQYIRSSYTQRNRKVTIVCPHHGEFVQIADTHLTGKGCAQCGQKRISVNEVVSRLHVNLTALRYDQPFNWSSYVTILCAEHGEFRRTAGKILNGQTRCPGCTQYGFDGTRKAYLYGMLSDDGKFIKIGISHNFKVRLSQLKKKTPFDFNLYMLRSGRGQYVRFVEKLIHKSFESANLSGFDGCTEWLVFDNRMISLCASLLPEC